MIRPFVHRAVRKHRRVAPRSQRSKPMRRRAIRLEALEERCLLTAGLGSDSAEVACGALSDGGQSSQPQASPMEATIRKWTFMVYMDGDNNLEPHAIGSFLKMASVGSTDDVNIVVELDRSTGGTDAYHDWTDVHRGLVQKDDVPDSWWGSSPGELRMGEYYCAKSFVEWAQENYPADHYALVFWNHGGGVNEGVCFDGAPAPVTSIQTSRLDEVFPSGQRLDLVWFDTCLMAGVEVAHEIRWNASVMVASAATVTIGGGIDNGYDHILTQLTSNPDMTGQDLARHIVAVFGEHHQTTPNHCISAVDLTRMTGLATQMDQLATAMLTTATRPDWDGVLHAHALSKQYWVRVDGTSGGDAQAPWSGSLYDLGDWMRKIEAENEVSSNVKAEAADVRRYLDECVIAKFSNDTQGRDYGLSVYAPFTALHPQYVAVVWPLDFVKSTRWEEFVGPRGIDVVEVIDTSGSMDSGGKLDAAKSAAKQFIDLMYPYDKLGVVSYDLSARVSFSTTHVTTAAAQAAKAAVDGLKAYGGTAIGDGIKKGDAELDRFPGDPVRAMLLLSDGKENVAPWAIPVISAEVDKDIVIHTIGFGKDADTKKLIEIAWMRKGQYYYAPTTTSLARIYFKLAGKTTGMSLGPTTSQLIQTGQEVKHDIVVDRMTARAVFGMDALDCDVDLTLVAPDGTVIDLSTPATNPLVSFQSDGAYKMYTVQLPMVGDWQMVARGVTVPASGKTVNLYASLDSPVGLSTSTDNRTYETGQVIHVQASFGDIAPILGATVACTVAAPSGSALAGAHLTMYDDGAHGDGAAGDGLYGAETDPLDKVGNYTLSADAQGVSYWGDWCVRHDFISVYAEAPATRETASIEVGPATVTLRSGQRQTFAAIGRDQDGNQCAIAEPVWEVYDPIWETDGVGTLQQNGATCTFTATQPGRWEIACYDAGNPSVRGTATVMITGVGLQDGRLQIVGSQGNDMVLVSRLGTNGLLVYTSFLSGSRRIHPFLSGGITEITVYGGAGRDTISVASNVTTLAWLYGGEGDDVLSGGRGSDVLVGGPGRDTLWGGLGRNVLIGGAGADSLFANTGDNLVIAGSTTYDDDQAALAAILAEWSRSDASYAARLGHLSGTLPGGLNLNRDCLLNGNSLRDDAARDLLFGGLGQNWYHARRRGIWQDYVFGVKRSEVVHSI